MKATIYIPDDQAKIYEDAKEKLGESVSKTFLKCLERELEMVKMETERIVVPILDQDTGRVAKKAFEGRFIVGSAANPEKFYFDQEETGISGGGGYAVAVTKATRLVVLEFDHYCENVIDFVVYENYDEFEDAEIDNQYPAYPESLVQAVSSELKIEHVENLDI